MPTIPQPQRQAGSTVTDADLDVLLAGMADAAPGLRPVADILAALTAEASAGELAGEARALAEFRHRGGLPVPRQRARRRPAGLTSRLGVKAGAAITAAAMVLGGAATAAFANVLPAPIQRLAHDAFGAPTPGPSRHLPAHHAYPAPGKRPAPGAPVPHQAKRTHGRPAPHATPASTAPGNPQGQGNHGNPQAKGKHGNPHGQGQGQQGNGQGQQGNGHGQGGGNPHKTGQHGNAHKRGQSRNPHALRRGGPHGHAAAGAHRARPARHEPVMNA
jgi:hypothetical protein